MSRRDVDIVVCGGGVAGAACASLLSEAGHTVALIEARRPDWQPPADDFDLRVVAVSPGSARILSAAGGWLLHDPRRRAEYRRMQVSAGRGEVSFSAQEHGLDQLGWIAEVPALQRAQWQAIERRGQIRVLAPVRVERIDPRRHSVRLDLDNGETLESTLVVAADGARSPLRQMAGIAIDEWHYNQAALVTHVRTERQNEGTAWQLFTKHGPLALLPLADGRSSIVWSQSTERVDKLLSLDDQDFLDELNAHQDSPFGPALSCTARRSFPLVRRQAKSLVSGRLVLLGDAARNVHPLAGQGLNLGLADAAALAEVLEGWNADRDPDAALTRYQRWRLGSGSLIAGGIHAINELGHGPLHLGTGLLGAGFSLASRLWPARESFVKRACGLDSDSPRLARS
ncbi:MAG: UbiH/UbiF family hydroxylase [Wenzhouxiangella sp.]|nr:MAG: UbiH/UbiF family hydroxylase [Wenzhouxiangella sp.]